MQAAAGSAGRRVHPPPRREAPRRCRTTPAGQAACRALLPPAGFRDMRPSEATGCPLRELAQNSSARLTHKNCNVPAALASTHRWAQNLPPCLSAYRYSPLGCPPCQLLSRLAPLASPPQTGLQGRAAARQSRAAGQDRAGAGQAGEGRREGTAASSDWHLP